MTRPEYKISTEPPPVYEEAVKRFGVNFNKGVVFTYGNTIHTSDSNLPEHLIEHECVHVRQQSELGAGAWWKLYFENPEFRLKQEIEAYRRQYEYIKKTEPVRKHFRFLKFYAEALCNIYGLSIDVFTAMKMIK